MSDKFTYEKLCEYLKIAKANRFKKLTLRNIGFPNNLGVYEGHNVLEFSTPLTTLPDILFEIDSLEELDLSGNQISYLSAKIGKLVNLRVLSLAKNRLRELPKKIGKLSSLEVLEVQNNKLSSLPSDIGQLTNLISLDASNNRLTYLPKGFEKLGSLQTLIINSNRIESLPDEFFQLKDLLILEACDMDLNILSPKVMQLQNLGKLLLSGNLLSMLPSEIGQLQNLSELSVQGNHLSELPKEIGKLRNLKYLNVSENHLTELPDEIGQLKELGILLAGSENWSGFFTITYHNDSPENHANHIKILPPNIGLLVNLTFLGLTENEIETLPKEIKNLANLERLYLKGNPLPIPPEILGKSDEPQTILDYYFSIIEQNKKTIGEVKLLIVGQGSVGKTSLVEQILHKTYNPSQTKTEGMSINQWIIENKSEIANQKSEIKLNIWDFGGQEIMHATHQFFLTKRSLYLLVLDSRLTQEENRVEYWLKIIQSFGGESPVLIVGNKTDQHPLDIDRTGLQKKYPNIVGFLETSAATGAGIEALKAEIANQVDALPHVRDLLPETWFTVKTKLENMGHETNFISHDDYDKLCDSNDVHDERSQHTLIGFLHDLGVVLYFQDDPRLESLGILNPQWVTNGVYKILNSHELFQSQGKLTLPLLNQILNLSEYPKEKRLFIVDMMKKFELCYDIEPDKSFLIPDLLPKDEPYTGEWNDALAFQIHYNVLPSSIITRFIVRMNGFIHKTIWRSGVVLKHGNNTALVKADAEDRKIYIWINGKESTRRDFLAMIRGEFEAIHKTIAKIEAVEKVPLPNAPEATPIDLTFLQKMASEGRESLPVQAGNQIIDLIVKEVLSRIETERVIRVDGNVTNSTIILGNENKSENKPKSTRKRNK